MPSHILAVATATSQRLTHVVRQDSIPKHNQPTKINSISKNSKPPARLVKNTNSIPASLRILNHWNRAPTFVRYFVSGNIGNIVLYILECLLSSWLVTHRPNSPQSHRDFITFLAAYWMHIPFQHILHAALVYGWHSINTLQKFWTTLMGMASAMTISSFGSTALNTILIPMLGKNIAFITTLYGFSILNFFVITFIVQKSNQVADQNITNRTKTVLLKTRSGATSEPSDQSDTANNETVVTIQQKEVDTYTESPLIDASLVTSQNHWNSNPTTRFIRYFLSVNLGNAGLYLLYQQWIKVLPTYFDNNTVTAYCESLSFFLAYWFHIPLQHLLHGILVFGDSGSLTRHCYWSSLFGFASALLVASIGSTLLRTFFQTVLDVSPHLAFLATLYGFSIWNYFVVGYIFEQCKTKYRSFKTRKSTPTSTSSTLYSTNNLTERVNLGFLSGLLLSASSMVMLQHGRSIKHQDTVATLDSALVSSQPAPPPIETSKSPKSRWWISLLYLDDSHRVQLESGLLATLFVVLLILVK